MMVVLVANTKGGCGKTTVATHLAAALGSHGHRTGLADADRQCSSLEWVRLRPGTAAPITALDWSKELTAPPKGLDRLVIDAALQQDWAPLLGYVALDSSPRHPQRRRKAEETRGRAPASLISRDGTTSTQSRSLTRNAAWTRRFLVLLLLSSRTGLLLLLLGAGHAACGATEDNTRLT